MQQLLLSNVKSVGMKYHCVSLDTCGQKDSIFMPENYYTGTGGSMEYKFSLRHIIRGCLPKGCKVELQVGDKLSAGRGEVDLGEGLRSILSYKVI